VLIMTVGWLSAIAVTLPLAVSLLVLGRGWQAVRQTTLIAAWWWAAVAVIVWAAVELAAALDQRGGNAWEAARLAATTLSFCPAMALLGAKRPQNRAWNFVVVSLWAILALPAAESFFLRPGQSPHIGDARTWFLWIMLLLAPINYAATRYAVPAFLLAAGQLIALAPYLALIRRPLVPQGGVVGLVAVAAALAGAFLVGTRKRTDRGYDRLWLDFRDAFGLFWAARVEERVNAAATQQEWNLELTWGGFRRRQTGESASEVDPNVEPALRVALKGLLRRFVMSEWIEQRHANTDDA
jgi:hypothetical protein